ncbi:MAG: hypothetical protein KKE20_02750 [Nanoarchaeota archaeon]|nr:hypothetical protein [Nanoarchaeota archaeon]
MEESRVYTGNHYRTQGIVDAALEGMCSNGFIAKEAAVISEMSGKSGLPAEDLAAKRFFTSVFYTVANEVGYSRGPIKINHVSQGFMGQDISKIAEPDPSVREHLGQTKFRKPYFEGPLRVAEMLLLSDKVVDGYINAVLSEIGSSIQTVSDNRPSERVDGVPDQPRV